MKINIVQMTGNYPLDIGGPSTVAYFLATKMVDIGINVSMTIRTKDKDELRKLREFDKFGKIENYATLSVFEVDNPSRYDGSCLPKDVKALISFLNMNNLDSSLRRG